MTRKAVIVGGLGVIGRNLMHHLAEQGGWEIVCLSRRKPDFDAPAEFVSVDLLDRADADAKLAHLADVTHIFYCAFQARPTWAEHNAPNLAMLVNSVEPIAAASRALEHVHLVEGNKIYGSHLGPFKTPAKEDQPPHLLPNFYWDQERWLEGFQKGKPWTWSALRPHTVCGFAIGNPMNITTCIAVYAMISREFGLPLRFPGKPGAYNIVYQATDSGLLARAMEWCAVTETAQNQVFNITNTDFFRWCNVWPKIADFFKMPVGEVQTIPLTQFMADKEPVWNEIVRKYGLLDVPYEDIASWPFADYVFGTDWDVMTSTVKIRQAGFHECLDSEEMFIDIFREFQDRNVIPKY